MSDRKTPSIPSVANLPAEMRQVLGPIKETLEFVIGRRPGQTSLKKVDADRATIKDIALMLNEIIARLSP